MRAAGTHLGTVGREPADVEAFAHAHLGEQLSEQQDALSSEAGNLNAVVSEMVRMVSGLAKRSFILSADFEHVRNGALRRSRTGWNFELAIAEHIQRECGNEFLHHPAA